MLFEDTQKALQWRIFTFHSMLWFLGTVAEGNAKGTVEVTIFLTGPWQGKGL